MSDDLFCLPAGPVAVMDGQSALCSLGARVIHRIDRLDKIRICPVQTELGRRLLTARGLAPGDPTTWMSVEDDRTCLQGPRAASIDGAMVPGNRDPRRASATAAIPGQRDTSRDSATASGWRSRLSWNAPRRGTPPPATVRTGVSFDMPDTRPGPDGAGRSGRADGTDLGGTARAVTGPLPDAPRRIRRRTLPAKAAPAPRCPRRRRRQGVGGWRRGPSGPAGTRHRGDCRCGGCDVRSGDGQL